MGIIITFRATEIPIFRWFIPVVWDYNISIDKVGKSTDPPYQLRY